MVGQTLRDALSSFQPNLVLYDAGVDIHRDDSLGRLSISDDGLRRREYLVTARTLQTRAPLSWCLGAMGVLFCRIVACCHTL